MHQGGVMTDLKGQAGFVGNPTQMPQSKPIRLFLSDALV